MKLNKFIIAAAAFTLGAAPFAGARGNKSLGEFSLSDLRVERSADRVHLDCGIVLDQMNIPSDKQVVITPIIDGGGLNHVIFPSVLVNGRTMQYQRMRGILEGQFDGRYNIRQEVKRNNGKAQTVTYHESVPFEDWMRGKKVSVQFLTDTCGCGIQYAYSNRDVMQLNFMPDLSLAYITPEVTEDRIIVHEGSARVQYEVNKTDLHDQPYRCKNGQMIDNRRELKTITDSIDYAVSDPNVEIASINLVGYASPESPYTHNEFLATNRAKSLADYIGRRYNLPAGKVDYSAVAENWEGLREMVNQTPDLSETQKKALLELIDSPAETPAQWDAKEKKLKTDRQFSKFYRSTMLPYWFPDLRCTKFTINTRLKPVSDEQLAKVLETSPHLLSLNHMFRIARLYKEGSPEYEHVIEVARSQFPNNPVVELNAAVAEYKAGNLEKSRELVKNAGDSPEAQNLRGVLAVEDGDYDAAAKFFESAAGSLPEAARNLRAIEK